MVQDLIYKDESKNILTKLECRIPPRAYLDALALEVTSKIILSRGGGEAETM